MLFATLEALVHKVTQGDLFQDRNRMGVNQTLHRISALNNRHGDADCITDILAKVASGTGSPHSASSLLLIGPPGVGKNTLLRDVTRQLADTFHKLVMVVDTSEEIAGGGDVPHTWIGTARRCWAPLVTASKKCWRKRLQTMDQRWYT
ncbi:hypothetical protein ABBQ32_012414 [Trebouxia sp. C0010 RCD-2024]